MCGIIFETSSRRNVNEEISEMYEDQKHRGDEGFGLVKINAKRDFDLYRCEIESIFINKLFSKDSKTILVHHRTPTSTDNEREQTHPMIIDDQRLKYEYMIVHNGIISNKDECREKFEKDGWEFKTAVDEKKFNDSEAFAIDLAMHLEGKWKDWTARGSIAFVALQVERETQKVEKVLFGRNTNPLNLYFAKSKKAITNLVVSSEGPGEEIDADMLYTLDLVSMKLKMAEFKIGGTYVYNRAYGSMYGDSYDNTHYAYGCRGMHTRKLLQGEDKTTLVMDKKANGFGDKVSINLFDKNQEQEAKEISKEDLEKIEEAEDAIADELGSYFADEQAFKFQDVIEGVIEELSSFDRKELYNRNKTMAKVAKLFIDAEEYAESLHDSYKDIDWASPIAEKDIEDEDEFNVKTEENDEIKHIKVH